MKKRRHVRQGSRKNRRRSCASSEKKRRSAARKRKRKKQKEGSGRRPAMQKGTVEQPRREMGPEAVRAHNTQR